VIFRSYFLIEDAYGCLSSFLPTSVLYAHHIDFWWYNKFDHPENYGLARELLIIPSIQRRWLTLSSTTAGKTVNLKIRSSDNTTIGAWFIFSDPFYQQLPYPPPPNGDFTFPQKVHIPSASKQNPTILFLHGNTGTRAHPLRTVLYTAFTARLKANVLAIDYRGFGDSEGYPSVHGVSKDARAGWDFLMRMGAKPEDVLIVGHSLGTAIAGLLSAELGREGIHPRGTVLMSVRLLNSILIPLRPIHIRLSVKYWSCASHFLVYVNLSTSTTSLGAYRFLSHFL